jgi:hypothetical protein
MSATELLVWGATVHLIVDWLFQNQWIAANKARLTHPAGYVHAAAHGVALLLVFPPLGALVLALAHFLIDSRVPLKLWSRVMSQPTTGAMAEIVHVWRDQALHLAAIAGAALIFAA